MNIVLLSGGSGKRLWPLSNDARSKQFLPLLEKGDGTMESMVQRVVRQIREAGLDADITISTNAGQRDIIVNQLGEDMCMVLEPERRDTFPAIALASCYLSLAKGCSEDETVVIMPCDPYTQAGYFQTIGRMAQAVQENAAELVLMGIKPTYPSSKYGYVVPVTTGGDVRKVRRFTEKPDVPTAVALLGEGALWNGGVFAFKLGYLMNIVRKYLKVADFDEAVARYSELPKISFDYEVAEKAESVAVVPYSGEWKDLGTWNTLTEAMEENTVGQAIVADTCENVHVLNELDMPIVCMGLNNVVVSASAEGILVSEKNESSYIKPIVDKLDNQIMFADKSWGSYRVMDVGQDSMTVKITLNPGGQMNYHSHDHRDEVWTILSGNGRTIVDGMEQQVKPGDVVTMARGCKHTIMADSLLTVLEVQLGEISTQDKKKYDTIQ